MQTRIDEIAAGVYRLSVYVPDIAPPVGFTFNHFLVRADEPMLFHRFAIAYITAHKARGRSSYPSTHGTRPASSTTSRRAPILP